jgi:hypothetical protein
VSCFSKKVGILFLLIFLTGPHAVFSSEEGTRHITGKGTDLYFMNDKVFGTVKGHPIWAVYDCGAEIRGEIDIKGTYHGFHLTYPGDGDRIITGEFGSLKMALGRLEKKDRRVIYPVQVEEKAYSFSIRYEKIQGEHMVNSIIDGEIEKGIPLTLTVDGALCPFATTGIIMVVVGSRILSHPSGP